jgi:chemotaxis response regulator CheB
MGVQAVRKMGNTMPAKDEPTSGLFGMPGTAIHTDDMERPIRCRGSAKALTDAMNNTVGTILTMEQQGE